MGRVEGESLVTAGLVMGLVLELMTDKVVLSVGRSRRPIGQDENSKSHTRLSQYTDYNYMLKCTITYTVQPYCNVPQQTVYDNHIHPLIDIRIQKRRVIYKWCTYGSGRPVSNRTILECARATSRKKVSDSVAT